MAVGKSAAALRAAEQTGAVVISVREILTNVLSLDPSDRIAMQQRGAELDNRTNGGWLVSALQEMIEGHQDAMVDSIRTRAQAAAMARLPDSRLIFLEASEATRRARYRSAASSDPMKARASFRAANRHPVERSIDELRVGADLVISTDHLSIEAVAAKIAHASIRR